MTRVLVVGGTIFIGPSVVRQLAQAGHEVAIFHRGEHEIDLPEGVRHIHGDRDRIGEQREAIAQFAPETVVDMRAMTGSQARATADAVRGIAKRLVVVSSMDVYLAYGRLHGTEPGPPLEPPFDEDTPVALIKAARPDVLVKGADYTREGVVGHEIVEAYGGEVKLAPLVDGHSTTATIRKLSERA